MFFENQKRSGDLLKNSLMMTAAMMSAVALAGCGQRGDHPESFVRPNAGPLDSISFYQSDLNGKFLSVEGIWTIEGEDRIATPINVSGIDCRAYDNTCTDRRAYLMSVGSSTFLDQDQDFYAIEKWDARELIAVADGTCRTMELRIDLVAETVMAITNGKPVEGCFTAETGLTKPRISRLISQDELAAKIKAGDI